jgi:hypothetical protein
LEPENRDRKPVTETLPVEDSSTGWFNMGCSLAAKGQLLEAERSIKIALNKRDDYPVAWAILRAILLSQGHETDAEMAGKMTLSQYAELKMTWPKLRSIMFSHAIQKGKDWKSPRRIRFEISESGDWSTVLSKLIEASGESLEKIETTNEGPISLEPSIVGDTIKGVDTRLGLLMTPEIPSRAQGDHLANRSSSEVWFEDRKSRC